MAKTQFIDGTTILTASFLNKIFRTDGGHKHDGIDADGHASKIDLRSEVTGGPNGTFNVPVENGDLHVIRHDHAGAGSAILQTDALRLHGAPRDATRRAQAPLDRSLYVQNAPKVLVRLAWNGTAWGVEGESYNITGGVFDGPNAEEYNIAVLDHAGIMGIVISEIWGIASLTGAPSLFVRPRWDSGGALIWQPRWDDAGTWKNFRDAAPPDNTIRLTMAMW